MLNIARSDLEKQGDLVKSLLTCGDDVKYTAGFVVEYDMSVWVVIDARVGSNLLESRQFRPAAVPYIMHVLHEGGEILAFLGRLQQHQRDEYRKVERQLRNSHYEANG